MNKPKHKLFDRVWGWSYIPSSLAGCAIMLLFIAFWLGVIFAAVLFSNVAGELTSGIIAAIVMVPTTIAFFKFVDEHSD